MNIEIKVLASSSKGNAYIVTDGETTLLVECGIKFKNIQRGLGFRVSGLAGCLLSHEHNDHALAVREIMRAGIDVYASKGTFDVLGISNYHAKVIKALKQFNIGTWTILPFDTVHDAAEPLGFLMASKLGGKVLYITDSAYCKYRFNGVTHFMVEANYSEEIIRQNAKNGIIQQTLKNRIIRNHMSIERLLDMLRANDLSQVREIWLLHLSNNNSDEERFRREIQGLTGKEVYIA